MNGKVWIVGAGSEAGLITVRGLEAVRGAQVVIYDDLLDRALLEEAPAGCELICVGKRKNSHKKEQEEIHELLIDRARRGLRVVRLKGGDPTVFGRGGEEALALQEAGVREISIGAECTMCNCHRFWSHRATKGIRGSQGAIIVCQEVVK
jgi:uroporphyrin-III C-methyltransferase